MTFQRTFDYLPLDEMQQWMLAVNATPWRGLGPRRWQVRRVNCDKRNGRWVVRTTVESSPTQMRIGAHLREGFQAIHPYQELDFRRVKFGRRLRARAV